MSVVWLGEPLQVTNSEIQTLKQCRRKWYLTYYRELGLKREKDSKVGARQLGTRIHLALHVLYTEPGANVIEALDGLYAEDAEQLTADQRYDEEIALRKEQDLAHAMIEGFLEWREQEGLDYGMELVAAEEVVETPSPVQGVIMRGKMDQRWVRTVDKARLFRDWKTVQSITEPQAMLPLDQQMLYYHILEFMQALEKTGSEPAWRTDGALYTMLRKVKRTAAARPPFYGQVEVHHNMAELRNALMHVIHVIEEIVKMRQALDSGASHQYVAPPSPGRDCTWKCDFLPVCPLMNDGSNWEGLLQEYYEHRDPMERYQKEEDGKTV